MKAPNPPSEKEISQLEQEATYPAVRLPLTIIPATGLFPSEFFHIHQDWIIWPAKNSGQDYPIIKIPLDDECRRKAKLRGRRKSTAGIVDQEGPCSICKKIGTARFRSPSSLDTERKVPIINDAAADELRLWFQKYDTIPWSSNLTRLQTISKNLINRTVTAYDLRFVFGRRAIKMGICDEIIIENLGLRQKPRWVLEYQREFTPKKTGQITYQQYLEVIDKNGPISINSISELLGRSESAVGHMLRKLEKNGFTNRVNKKGKGKQARDLWDVNVRSDTLLSCVKKECDKEFNTFRGLTAHTTREH